MVVAFKYKEEIAVRGEFTKTMNKRWVSVAVMTFPSEVDVFGNTGDAVVRGIQRHLDLALYLE